MKRLFVFVYRLTDPPASLDPEQAQSGRLLVALAWLVLGLIPAALLLVRWQVPEQMGWLSIVAAIVAAVWGAVIILVKRGRVRQASYVMITMLWLVATGQAFLGGGLQTAAYVGYLPLVALAGTLLGVRAMVAVTGVSILSGAGLVVLDVMGRMPAAKFVVSAPLFWISVSIFTVVLAVLLQFNKWVAQRALQRGQAELEERIRAEHSLRESENRFAALFEYAPLPLSLVRMRNSELLDVNLAWRNLWGFERDDAVGRTALGLHLWGNAEDRTRMVAELHDRRYVSDFETVIRSATAGERHVLLSARLTSVGGEECMILQTADITERRILENDLREANERFDQIAAHIPEVFWVYDIRAKRPTYVSKAFETIWERNFPGLDQYTKVHIEGLHPEDREGFRAVIARRDSGEPTETEYRVLRPDGSIRWVSEHSFPVFDTGGQLVRTVGLASDVTERKLADEARRESEEKYRTLLASVDSVLVSVDRDGNVLYMNESAARYLGSANAAPSAGKTMYEIFAAFVAEPQMERVRKVIAEGQPSTDSEHLMVIQGVARWFRSSIYPVRDHTGQVVHALINASDITVLKESEAALRQQLDIQKMVAGISQLLVGIDSHNSAGVIQEALALLGRRAGVDRCFFLMAQQSLSAIASAYHWCAEGVAPSIVSVQEFESATSSALSRQLLSDGVVNIPRVADLPADLAEVRHMTADGVKSILLLPVRSNQGPLGIIGFSSVHHERTWQEWELNLLAIVGRIIVDGLENLQREQEILDLNQSLEKRVQERTEELRLSRDDLSATNAALLKASHAKDEFLANMSHELRTPLNGILTTTEMLLTGFRGPVNDHQRRLLGIVESSGRHLLSLINDVLDLSKVEAGRLDLHPEYVVVEDVCRSSLAFVKEPALKGGLTLDFIADDGAATFWADPRRMKQILVNLLSNAVKFTPAGGRVTLRVQADAARRRIEFSVTDTGIGIAQADMHRLFTPFTQVESGLARRYEGTGLGLALVKDLVALHGGEIHVTSEVGKGSCFIVELPWRGESGTPSADAAVEEVAPAEDIRNAPQSGTILLVEDNAINAKVVAEYLSELGYNVMCADNGQGAIDLAETILPDMILMDIQLPGISGLDAIQALRANPRFATTPIIALTALAMAGDRERCLAAGASEYLSKPVDLAGLAEMIQRLLARA